MEQLQKGDGQTPFVLRAGLIYRLRCQNPRCKKLMGKVDGNTGIVHIKSNRSGFWIEIFVEVGKIVCQKCGNWFRWEKGSITEKGRISKDK